jgi:hypothetical protein
MDVRSIACGEIFSVYGEFPLLGFANRRATRAGITRFYSVEVNVRNFHLTLGQCSRKYMLAGCSLSHNGQNGNGYGFFDKTKRLTIYL